MAKESQCSVKTKMKMATALKELLMTSDFERITVSDITDKCGIHRQTFYYHFQDRNELLEWLIYKELIEPFLTGFSLDNVYEKINAMLVTIYNEKQFYQSMLSVNNKELSDYIMKTAKAELAILMQDLRNSSLFENNRSESSGNISGEFFGFGLAGVVLSWIKDGMKISPDELTEEIVRLAQACKIVAVRRI